MHNNLRKIEFGDFQTPAILAGLMADILEEQKIEPEVIIEPTCGTGEILITAVKRFNPELALGVEINSEYYNVLLKKTEKIGKYKIINENIFSYLNNFDLKVVSDKKILLIGNPPWVTNSKIGAINGLNLPRKTNYKKLKGIDAITGKSNFDIAEYILLKLINEFHTTTAIFAFLCKTIVARNLLKHIWTNKIKYKTAHIYHIDSVKYFNASVDACYFVIDFTEKQSIFECKVYDSIENRIVISNYEYQNKLVLNNNLLRGKQYYFGKSEYIWRNGIKHDCSKVMELNLTNDGFENGFGKVVDIEKDLLYPLLKSSDLTKEKILPRKYVIITQRHVGEDTSYIKIKYPKTWKYLLENEIYMNARKSKIYLNKPKFSIFSVGDYSFSKYKVAISGLYKTLQFKILNEISGKPIMVDDTCNFIPCETKSEAKLLLAILTSQEASLHFNSVIFWDSKRPITTQVLNEVNLFKIAKEIGLESQYNEVLKVKNDENILQAQLFY